MLVKGEGEEGQVLLRGGTQGPVDTLDKALTEADRRQWVEREIVAALLLST